MEPALPVCPRCEYDLRGESVKWQDDSAQVGDSCPMTGRCTECGLDFVWGDVFNARQRAWFIEHATTIISPYRCVTTWFRAIGIIPFWTQIQLEHKPRMWRMLEWLFWLGCVAMVTGSACYLWAASMMAARIGSPVEKVIGGFPLQIAYEAFMPHALVHSQPVVVSVLAGALMYPLVLLVLPETRKRSKVSLKHLLRGATYGLSWVGVVLVGIGAARMLGLWKLYGFSVPYWWEGPAWDPTPTWADSATAMTTWILVGVAWSSIWWLLAIRNGFRIRQWGRVWLAVTVPAVLAGIGFPLGNEFLLHQLI